MSNIAVAEQELEMVTKLFNGIVGTISSLISQVPATASASIQTTTQSRILTREKAFA
jgi:hypothetical protein